VADRVTAVEREGLARDLAVDDKAAVADNAASTRTMNAFRNTGECAEKPEQIQCRAAAPAREVSRRVRLGLIMGHPGNEGQDSLAIQ
jgi:hypothetical protein